jgi:hypothetical protein
LAGPGGARSLLFGRAGNPVHWVRRKLLHGLRPFPSDRLLERAPRVRRQGQA